MIVIDTSSSSIEKPAWLVERRGGASGGDVVSVCMTSQLEPQKGYVFTELTVAVGVRPVLPTALLVVAVTVIFFIVVLPLM